MLDFLQSVYPKNVSDNHKPITLDKLFILSSDNKQVKFPQESEISSQLSGALNSQQMPVDSSKLLTIKKGIYETWWYLEPTNSR